MIPHDGSSIDSILPIIMAGGRGERLSPMTDTVPKPLLPIDGVPAIVRILRLLASFGFTRAAVTLGYLADDIRTSLGEVCEGITLFYAVEDMPLGTAGGVLSAWDDYATAEDTDALILSGDAVASFALTDFLGAHRRFSSEVTVLSASVADPTAFGEIVCDGEGRIRAFCEKPAAMETVTDLVNTGIYLMTRPFLSTLARGVFLDFGADVLPTALAEHRALYTFQTEGFWCDIGTVEAFRSTAIALASGALAPYSPLLAPTMRALPQNAVRSSVGEGCFVHPTASVGDSVLFRGVMLAKGVSVTRAVLCEGVSVGAHAVIGEGSVIGAGARIAAGAVLPPRARVAPYAVIGAGDMAVHAIPTATPQELLRAEPTVRVLRLSDFTHDSGIYLSAKGAPTVPNRAVCSALGRSLVRLFANDAAACTLLLMQASEAEGIAAAYTLLSQAAMAECEALKAEMRPTLLHCEGVVSFVAARFFPAPAVSLRVLLTVTDGRLSAVLATQNGRYLSRKEERRLDARLTDLLSSPAPVRVDTPTPLSLSAVRIEDDFLHSRLALLSARPSFAGLTFRTGTSPTERLLARCLHTLGAREGERAAYAYHMFEAGELADASGMLAMADLAFPTRIYSHWELYAMWLLSCAPPPPLLCLPFGVPQYVIAAAVRCGTRVELYSHYPEGGSPSSGGVPSLEACDPTVLAVRMTALLHDRDTSLSALYAHAFGSEARHVRLCRSCDGDAAASKLRRVARDGRFSAEKEGVSFVPPSGEGAALRVYNSRTQTLRIVADALSAEAAEALCTFAREALELSP